ncbi:MAG: hypothetical protein H6644_09185 [Caldilineaceae bacterium]|nr:hypothetical protein [Caldilineaceae bacterium]
MQDDGRAVVSGTAAPGARVRVALSGRPLDTAIAGDDGRWEVQTAQPVSGLYTVSADVVDATGAVRALAVPVFAMLQAAPATNTPTSCSDSHRYAGADGHGCTTHPNRPRRQRLRQPLRRRSSRRPQRPIHRNRPPRRIRRNPRRPPCRLIRRHPCRRRPIRLYA